MPDGTYHYLGQTDDSYFSDARFIGDSRTEGLALYSMRNLPDFACAASVSLYNIYDKPLHFYHPDGSAAQAGIMDVLRGRQYGKIYLSSLGVNGLGSSARGCYYGFRQQLTVVRQCQPEALICIEGTMHVSGAVASDGTDLYINNTNIVQRSQALLTLASGRDIFCPDMNSAVCDGDGNLSDADTADGIHLRADAYELWHRFLLNNAAVN